MAKIDILKDRKRAIEFMRGYVQASFEEAVQRAAEIVEEEYEKLFNEAAGAGITGILGTAETERTERTRNGYVYKATVQVPKEGEGGNLVFHVLNEGMDALGAASDYGLKAWPIHLPRRPDYGNTPMTRPGSPEINMAGSNEDVIYRPFIGRGIEPRNFTKEILRRAQERINEEGLAVIVTTDQQ